MGIYALFVLGTIVVFYLFKLYHTLWIYAGINELMAITFACIAAILLQIAGMELYFFQFQEAITFYQELYFIC